MTLPRPFSRAIRRRMKKMLREGHTMREIGAACGHTEQWARKWIKEFGITMDLTPQEIAHAAVHEKSIIVRDMRLRETDEQAAMWRRLLGQA